MTVLVCSNSGGTDKQQLVFIGTALKPRVYKRKKTKKHGINYRANRRAWMTADLFLTGLYILMSGCLHMVGRFFTC